MKVAKRPKACVIAPFNDAGGVAQASLHYCSVFEKLGYQVNAVNLRSLLLPSVRLDDCDILQVNSITDPIAMLRIARARRPIKVLTLHGWVTEEAKLIPTSSGLGPLLGTAYFFFTIVNWILHKFVFIPFVYDAVTAISETTALRNGVDALILKNPVNPSVIERRVRAHGQEVRHTRDHELTFVTYVSIGGRKILTVPRLVHLIFELNRTLRNRGSNSTVRLIIYGKDLPDELLRGNSEYVQLNHYSPDFLEQVRKCSLMLLGYSVPELGYTAIEAGILGVPVAKFTDNEIDEELIDGVTGILAKDDKAMLEKLTEYVTNENHLRETLGQNLRKHLLETRSIEAAAPRWRKVFDILLSRNRHMRKGGPNDIDPVKTDTENAPCQDVQPIGTSSRSVWNSDH